jgi:hypothetical protein
MTTSEDLPVAAITAKSLLLRVVPAAAFAGILVVALVYPFPWSGRPSSELFNLAHAPSFFAAFTLLAGLLDPVSIGLPESWYKILPMSGGRLLVLASLLFMIGAVCEVMQGFVGRLPSVSDLLANVSGLFAGLCWSLSRIRIDQASRSGLPILAAGLLIVPSCSPILEMHDCYLQHQEFPLLSSFERTRELHTWYAHEATLDTSVIWATHGAKSLRVRGLTGTKFPGANFSEPVANWQSFSALELDVFNPGGTPLTLRITVSDEAHANSGYAHTDRFADSVELPPGKHVPVRIKLADVQSAPESRQMDLSQINSLNLFVQSPESDFELMIDNVRLTERKE